MTKDIDAVYMIYVNSDTTEGRGHMIMAKNTGFFTDEDKAWDVADMIPGIMGRKPVNGTWRKEKYPDVQVRKFLRHDSYKFLKIKENEEKIKELQEEVNRLKKLQYDI